MSWFSRGRIPQCGMKAGEVFRRERTAAALRDWLWEVFENPDLPVRGKMRRVLTRETKTVFFVLCLALLGGCGFFSSSGVQLGPRGTGTVRIIVENPGAEIAFDGSPRGKSGKGVPIVIKGVVFGWHTARVSLPGFVTRIDEVEVGSEETTVRIALRESVAGRVSIYTTPPGGEIFIDSRYYGKAAPEIKLPRLPFGTHSLWIRLEGYVNESRSIIVDRQTDRAYRMHLEKK